MTVVPISAAPSFKRNATVIRRVEVQRLLGVGRSRLYELMGEGLPVAGKDHRGRLLFRVADVQEWMSRRMPAGLTTTHGREI